MNNFIINILETAKNQEVYKKYKEYCKKMNINLSYSAKYFIGKAKYNDNDFVIGFDSNRIILWGDIIDKTGYSEDFNSTLIFIYKDFSSIQIDEQSTINFGAKTKYLLLAGKDGIYITVRPEHTEALDVLFVFFNVN